MLTPNAIRRPTVKPRFYVSMWHGEAGSIATVIDRRTGRARGQTTSWTHGAEFRKLADISCESFNRRYARG